MKSLIARIDAFCKRATAWTYRPKSMRPAMRKRLYLGKWPQCQVYKDGKWIAAEFPASRYQWQPRTPKVLAAIAVAGIGAESNVTTIHKAA